MDRTNLQRKIVELDDMVKRLLGKQSQMEMGALARLKEIDVRQKLGHSEVSFGSKGQSFSPS